MKQKIKILLADDDSLVRKMIPRQLDPQVFEVGLANSGRELIAELKRQDYDAVLLDINLPDNSGLELLPVIRRQPDAPEVVMLTHDDKIETGLQAMRLGAYDYLIKPASGAALDAVLRKAWEKRDLIRQNERLRSVVQRQASADVLKPVYASERMRQIFDQAKRVAPLDTTILITGESGTGKDVLVRWIHEQSPRAAAPLIAVNCGALPENLFESEFFGHEKGAFTGATAGKIGLLEAADNSTLFLDEIGDMPLAMQVKLLHFLENSWFRRVGSIRDRHVNARIIAATNRLLEADVQANKFRADLFYRLNVVSFHLPALRERSEDIRVLIDFFLERLRRKFNRPRLDLTHEVRLQLQNQIWRGNIRELRNTLERAAVLSATDKIEVIEGLAMDVFAFSDDQNAAHPAKEAEIQPLAEIEKQYILRAIKQTGGKRERTAALLGITVRTLYRKLQDYDQS